VTRSREFLVGLVILVGLAIGVFGTLWLQGVRFGQVITEVHVLARDVGQLADGNAVKFRGVDIGEVGSITVEPSGTAVRIRLLLDTPILLSDEAAVVIAPESMFGDWQAEIVTRSRYPRYDYYEVPVDARMQSGIRVLGGYTLPDISRLTAVADEVAENLATLTDRFDRAFSDETAAQLAAAIDNMEQMTATLRTVVDEQSGEIRGIAEQVRIAAEEGATALTAVRTTLARVDTLVSSRDIDSILVNTREITSGLRGVSGDVASAAASLESTLEEADSTMARLNRVAALIESGDGTVARLLRDPTAAHEIETILRQVNILLEDIRANPRRYVRLSIF
jgi:phospholipid/cholesterol/gamma-HCH transport system substrate-binding protein